MVLFQKKLSPIDALFATFSDPYGTTKHLLVEREPQPYLLLSLTAVFAVTFGPALLYQWSINSSPKSQDFNATIVALLFTVPVLFLFSSLAFFRLFGIKSSLKKLLAIAIYSLSPLIPFMLGLHGASYLIDGRFSLAEYYATGAVRPGDVLIDTLPYALALNALYIFTVFLNGVRVMGRCSIITSACISVACTFWLIGSYLTALVGLENFFPGISAQVNFFVQSLIFAR